MDRSRLYSIILFLSLLFSFLNHLSPTASQQTTASPPLSVTVFAPLPGDVVGLSGAGWVVDLAIDARSPQFNSLLSPSNGYKPAFLNPANSTQFHPGNNSATPGLVCLFSNTPTVNGSLLQGPQTNLAGLFQINAFSLTQNGTIAQVWNTWYVHGQLIEYIYTNT
jgi:hypothetical protein